MGDLSLEGGDWEKRWQWKRETASPYGEKAKKKERIEVKREKEEEKIGDEYTVQ
jgi:hypothetical protein